MPSRLHRIIRLIASVCAFAGALAGAPAFGEGTNPTETRPYAPTTGTINNLVIFIRFSDQPEFAQSLSYYDGLFNSAGNSLKNFYLENSYNALTVNSTFYPVSGGSIVSYQDSHPTGYYQAYNATTNPLGYQGAESTARETALVTNALAAISAQAAGLNLDGNNDGYVDHITFEVYSSAANPAPVLFYSRAAYDWSGGVVFNSKKLGAYTWVTGAQDNPNTGSTLGATEIHEMGHSFGYPDLRANSGRQPVGDWDVMSTSNVVHSGAYMKNRFTNWITSIPEISAYGSYTLNDLTQASNNSYKIGIPNSSEYLILEYRKAAGTFESNLFGSGLCVTRVNEAAGIWGNLGGNPPNSPFFLYYYRLNGTASSDGTGNAWEACFSAESGRVQFNNSSNPACFLSDGSACGISIANIGSAAGSSISFALTDPNAVVVTRRISGILSLGGSRVSGATVTLSSGASGTTTSDSLGNYNFVVADGGNYTVTPAKANLTFTPASKSFSAVTSDQTQNFTATNNTNTISGTVTLGGTPVSGMTVVCNSGCTPQLATTDANGAYSFTVNAGGTYDVYPGGNTGYYFSPNTKNFANITSNQSQSFAAQSITTTTLASSQNPSASGQSITFTATVAGGTPTGSVTFSSSGVAVCGAVAVANGQAQCATSILAAGNRSITAAYSGDSGTSSSTSGTLTQVVTPAPVTAPAAPTVVTAPSGTLTALTDTTPVVAAAGSALVVPSGTATAGTRITLTGAATSTATSVVTLTIDSQSISLQPAMSEAVLTLKTVTVNGAPTLALGVGSGSVTVTAASGRPMLVLGNATAPISAGTDGASVSQTVDGTTGSSALTVTSGEVVLPANTFDASALKDGKVYAGETAQFDANGSVTQVRLGSPSGQGGAGDALKAIAPSNIALGASVPDLTQATGRSVGTTLVSGLGSVIALGTGLGLLASAQNASGVVNLAFDGGRVNALPFGEVVVDTSRADGMTVSGSKIEVTMNGLVTTVVPSVGDFTDFASRLTASAAGSSAAIQTDGTIRAVVNGETYLLQPGWTATRDSGAAGFSSGGEGYLNYVDAAGTRQVLYPAFADVSQLTAVLRLSAPGVDVVASGNGSIVAGLAGSGYALLPDYTLIAVPAGHAADTWWSGANGKFFIRYSDGMAQGFAVK